MPRHDGTGARQGYGEGATFDKGLGKGLYKVGPHSVTLGRAAGHRPVTRSVAEHVPHEGVGELALRVEAPRQRREVTEPRIAPAQHLRRLS